MATLQLSCTVSRPTQEAPILQPDWHSIRVEIFTVPLKGAVRTTTELSFDWYRDPTDGRKAFCTGSRVERMGRCRRRRLASTLREIFMERRHSVEPPASARPPAAALYTNCRTPKAVGWKPFFTALAERQTRDPRTPGERSIRPGTSVVRPML